MKNPYLYGYLPLFTIILFSLSFGIFTVNRILPVLSSIGVYAGMREFLSDLELRVFLLIVLSLCFFMLFSALKLIGQTIHEVGMLFFSKDKIGETMSAARGGYVIFFFGSLLSVLGIASVNILMAVFALTVFVYFIYTIYKMSRFMSMAGMIGLIIFEILFWSLFITLILYILLRLYNGILASLPFAN
ncbi:DUF5366 family protein [Ureibacillus acetophenoni]|uniref:Membrane protein YufK n=1 Tax=Ureibacillus acetophenoni TaxID=614649 RepID=A0A285UIH4_9BACL|nr:DUF5366 family protein [Ureibacillus acetophenoni]SOC41208.1 hypothetical protein SAMN05877842_109129 [Ureibacillus acetophenoni]